MIGAKRVPRAGRCVVAHDIAIMLQASVPVLDGATTKVVSLDRVLAEAVGRLLRRCGASDVVDASVVVVARAARGVVVTSDPDDLRALEPSIELVIP